MRGPDHRSIFLDHLLYIFVSTEPGVLECQFNGSLLFSYCTRTYFGGIHFSGISAAWIKCTNSQLRKYVPQPWTVTKNQADALILDCSDYYFASIFTCLRQNIVALKYVLVQYYATALMLKFFCVIQSFYNSANRFVLNTQFRELANPVTYDHFMMCYNRNQVYITFTLTLVILAFCCMFWK